MRILYLHQYFTTPQMAGGTRSYEMARRWAAAGHEVHVVTSERTADHAAFGWQVEHIEGLTIHRQRIPYSNAMPFRRRLIAFARFALLAGPRGRALRPDVVFATSTPLTIAIPARLATIGRPTPLVFEVRDLWPEVPIAMGILRNPVTKTFARLLERLAYKWSSHVIALSPGMADGVRKTGYDPDQITIAPNACDFERFAVDSEVGSAYRAKASWLGDRPLIAYCGTFGRANNVAYLVEVAAALQTRGSNAVVGLFGSGMEEPEIRRFAFELGVLDRNLIMAGEIPKEQVPAVLSAASLCVSVFAPVPALEANSANKFFDALAAARPIAINYRGWQAAIIQKHNIGLVLDPRDPGGAAAAIDTFLDQPTEFRQAAGDRASRVGRQLFDRDTVSSRVLAVLESVERPRISDRWRPIMGSWLRRGTGS